MRTASINGKEYDLEILENPDDIQICFVDISSVDAIMNALGESVNITFTNDQDEERVYENLRINTIAIIHAKETDMWSGTRITVVLTKD